jgi:hypothetical protein
MATAVSCAREGRRRCVRANFEDVVVWAVGGAEVSDAVADASCFYGGFVSWVPDDHDVCDLLGSEIRVPEDQVAWF